MKDFVALNFSEYFKSIRDEQNLRKVAKSLYIFVTTPDEVEKYDEIMQTNSSHNYIHSYNVDILNIFEVNTKSIIKNR